MPTMSTVLVSEGKKGLMASTARSQQGTLIDDAPLAMFAHQYILTLGAFLRMTLATAVQLST